MSEETLLIYLNKKSKQITPPLTLKKCKEKSLIYFSKKVYKFSFFTLLKSGIF